MLAIIPARGGSKGVSGKNIRLLCGKPLIAYTIEAAMVAKTIDRIIVSTDDAQIAAVAREYGVEVPFMRPKELAQDDSLAIDNYLYTINRLNTELNGDYEEFTVLLPTVPLRQAQDIEQACALFLSKKADSVISCTELPHPKEWIFDIRPDGTIQRDNSVDTRKMMNRQANRAGFIPNGAVFVLTYSLLKNKYSYYTDKTFAYVMPPERSVDIDSLFDFEYAQYLMGRR